MNNRAQRAIVFACLIAAVGLFAVFLGNILVPFIRMELNNDIDGAKELLVSTGALGFLSVALVEALQMVVVFIPAEFIQISSGMSYPFPVAVLLCDAGICLGATIIYTLVRVFRFSSDQLDQKERVIDRIAATTKNKSRDAVLLLYLLFIMPFIPFGAICYYGSHRGLRYRRYILTVATGVLPSIVTSNLMGMAGRYFLSNDLPLPLLVAVIALLAVALFACLFLFLDKVYLKENDGTPDSAVYSAFFALAGLLLKRRQRLHVDNTALRGVKPPFIVLCNHESFYDFYYVKQIFENVNPAYVVNRHYISMPVVRTLARKAGFIPKRLFNKDVVTPVKVMRAVGAGYPVVIFPEGRLSLTGAAYPIVEKGASFYRRLSVPLAFVRISGAYSAKPKWRRAFYPSDISVRVERVIGADEVKAMDEGALDGLIASALSYDESERPTNAYRQKDRAKGLENALYRCIDCGALYATRGVKNALSCNACGAAWHLDERYRFAEAPYTIEAYYRRICGLERAALKDLRLETPVRTVIFHDKGRYRTHDRGICTLTNAGFSYRSERESFVIGFESLSALPFSCGEEFEVYHNDDLYYFYPTAERAQITRWALLVDLMKEKRDEEGKI